MNLPLECGNSAIRGLSDRMQSVEGCFGSGRANRGGGHRPERDARRLPGPVVAGQPGEGQHDLADGLRLPGSDLPELDVAAGEERHPDA